MADKEFEKDDPMLLAGVSLPGDTEEAMAETFVEEFVKMGYSDETILKIFQNPHFAGAHQILRGRGEPYVQNLIARIRSIWGGIRYRTEDTEVENA